MNRDRAFYGNIGEWSEAYVFLKLLGDGRLYSATADMEIDEDLFFPLVKVFRGERSGRQIEFRIDSLEGSIVVEIDGASHGSIPEEKFKEEAETLFSEMKAPHDSAAFSVPQVEYFITDLGCESIKAASTDKTDISLQIHDPQTGYESICGFSIKSQVGSPSTLLNATRATNFTYKVNGLKKSDVEDINSIGGSRKIIDRMTEIFSRSRSVVFDSVDNPVFARNLMLIDSRMDEILAEALVVHYRDNVKRVSDVVEILEEDNPLGFPASGFYRYKIKKLLCAIALGFQPSTEWDGKDEANGGYIIVTRQGSVIAYHIYNRDQFEDYLLDSTYFERGSTSRHCFASLYESENGIFVKLNLQIRF